MLSARPLRIAIVGRAGIGGSGIVATTLANELAERGHIVHLVASARPPRLATGPRAPRWIPSGMHDDTPSASDADIAALAATLRALHQRERLDIVHAHYATPFGEAAALAGADRPPLVVTLHGTDVVGEDGASPTASRLEAAILGASAITAVSADLRARARAACGPLEIALIPNFHRWHEPLESRATIRARLGLAADEVVIVHASNLRPIKRLDAMVDALAAMEATRPWRLLVVGGANHAALADLAGLAGIPDRMVIVPAPADAVATIAAGDLMLSLSAYESFGLALLEGMAAGLPPVATRVGGVPEVVQDGVTGLLVPPADTAAAARALTALVDDPAMRAQLAAAARTDARTRFAPDAIVPRYEALYHSLLG